MIDIPHLASRLYGTPLLVAQPKLDVILSVMDRKWAGETMRAAETPVARSGGIQITETGIAVIPILGTLVRRSSYLGAASGLTSYHDIDAMAEAAFTDPEVNAVLLEIDSSGGEAGGVFDLACRLRSLAQTSGKPLWAIADEAALSAAYALACAADRLWLTRTAEVGSIGVVAVHVDESAADAKAGRAYTFVHAGANKVDGHPHAPLTTQVTADIQTDIDALYAQFVALVAGHRHLALDAVRGTEARCYRGDAAIAAGLADQIGTLREAITALERSATLERSALAMRSASPRVFTHRPSQETSMSEQAAVILDDTLPPDTPDTPEQDDAGREAVITAQVEDRLRSQMAEITEIAAQARRIGVSVDPAQAMAQRVTPDALRKSVLQQAAEGDAAKDIVAQTPAAPSVQSLNQPSTQSVAASPLVKAAQSYGAQK